MTATVTADKPISLTGYTPGGASLVRSEVMRAASA